MPAASPPSFSVRPVTEADWRQLRDLRLEMLRDTPIAYLETLDAALAHPDDEWRMRGRRNSADSRSIAAIRDDGRWIGTVGAFIDPRGRPLLVGVYVAPDVRGQGVLDALLADIEQWTATRGGILTLTVHEDNARARAAYLRRGFRETGETEPYPLDTTRLEIEMAKDVSAQPDAFGASAGRA